MPSKKIALILSLVVGMFLHSAEAFAGSGRRLAFNDNFDLITENLTGPTARTFAIVAFIAALLCIQFGQEKNWVKHLGTALVFASCIVGLPSVLSTMGVTGAEVGEVGAGVDLLMLTTSIVISGLFAWLWSAQVSGVRGCAK